MRLRHLDLHLACRRKFDGRVRIGTYDTIPPRACRVLATVKMYGNGNGDDDGNGYQLEERIRAALKSRRTKGGWYTVNDDERDALAAWFNSINQWTLDWYAQAGTDAHPIRFSAALDKRLAEITFRPKVSQSTRDCTLAALSMSSA